jgi:methyl-accepting chemotaxis protein
VLSNEGRPPVISVEEQNATVNEISRSIGITNNSAMEVYRNIHESATGLTEISKNVQGVNSADANTVTGINTINQSLTELVHLTNELKTIITQFKV